MHLISRLHLGSTEFQVGYQFRNRPTRSKFIPSRLKHCKFSCVGHRIPHRPYTRAPVYFLTGAPVGAIAPVLTGAPVGAMAQMPVVGDTVMFLSAAFQVYDDFPTGAPVSPFTAFVDYLATFVVEDVRAAISTVPRRRRGNRRRGPPQEVMVTAVRLTTDNGTMVWTIFSKGGHPRMEIVDPSLILV